jgi:hypothetical protein
VRFRAPLHIKIFTQTIPVFLDLKEDKKKEQSLVKK